MNRKRLTVPICKLLASVFTDEFVAKCVYRARFKKKLDLDNPRTFNEKVNWLKLRYYPQNELAIKCADKYQVRDYIAEKGYERYLNDLLGVWDDPAQIDWSALPNSFAMKCNHGMGYNIICPDKAKLDVAWAKRNIRVWFSEDFGYETSEPHYRSISKKVILERYLESIGAKPPIDWQFFTFGGKVKMILVRVPDELSDGRYHHYIFNEKWEPMDVIAGEAPCRMPAPSCLNELISASEDLGSPFPFLRVDFYIEDGRPIFGELTFTSSSGYSKTFTDQAQLTIGDWIELPCFNKGESS